MTTRFTHPTPKPWDKMSEREQTTWYAESLIARAADLRVYALKEEVDGELRAALISVAEGLERDAPEVLRRSKAVP